MRFLLLPLITLAVGCVPTSIPSTPPPTLDEVAQEMATPNVLTLLLREGTFDGTACSQRILAPSPGTLSFATVEFPGARDSELLVETGAVGPFRVGETVEVRVSGTACAPRLRYGSRPVEGPGRVKVTANVDGQLSGVLVADLVPPDGVAARAGRSVRVLGSFTLAPPDETVSE